MIEAIYVLGLFAAVLVNIAALTLLVLPYVPFSGIARASGVLLVCLAFFSLEHFVGLGRIAPLFIPLTALSLFVIWRNRERFGDQTFRASEIVFLCAIAYGALWRLAFPEVIEDNDRLTDFHFVANYMAGDRLPPLDYWLPPGKLDYYYALQHYSAALLGRLLGLTPGASFTLGPIILPALVLGLAWDFLAALRLRLWAKLLSIVALAIGGTGISPLLHLITTPSSYPFLNYGSAVEALIYNSRLLGQFDSSVASPAWLAVFGETEKALRLPIETFGYQYAIGGFHPVLSGFLLQFLALAIIAVLPRSSPEVRPRLEFLLGLSVPLALCCNAWIFPLQAALVAAWAIFDRRSSGEWHLVYGAAGIGIGVLLLLPFLAGLAAASGYMQLYLLPSEQQTPLVQFLVVWWPLLVLALAVVFSGLSGSLAGMLAALFVALLVFDEIASASDGIFLSDHIRFNATLKWWGWIFTGGVFSLSALLLASGSRAARVLAASVLVLISVFAVDAGRYFAFRSHEFAGKIDGMAAYANDPGNGRMLRYLVDAPRGVVLEPVYDEFPRDTGIYGSFAVKPNVVGIPYVLEIWKRNVTELPGLVADVNGFYAGTLDHPLQFLADHDVRYVVWSLRESKNADAWQAINSGIGAGYRWVEFSNTPETHIGLWIRR
jgi:hypothetical protein